MAKVFEVAFQLGAELTSSFTSAFGDANSALAGLGAAAAAIGGIVGFGALATQLSDMSDALNKLEAQTGATSSEMEDLEDVATNIFRDNYGETFDDVTLAIANVKQNMHNLDNGELERMTKDALMFADTFDGDINEITRASQNMMENFGISSSKSMDMFAAGAQRGLNFSDEMLDNVAEYSPLFAQMGYSAEEYFGILERGSKAGVYNLDYVNDVMKEFQIRVKDGSKATNESMAALSKDTQKVWKEFLAGKGTVSDVASTVVAELKGMEDQVEAGNIAVGLFGTKWEDLEDDAMYAMLGTTEGMKDFEGAMAAINEVRFDSVGKALQGIGRILFMDLVYPLNDTVLPYLNKFANFLKDSLPTAIDTFKDSLTVIVPLLVGAASGFIGFQAAVIATKAVTGLSAAITFLRNPLAVSLAMTQLWTKAQALLNATLFANPIGLVVGLLVGVGAAFYTAYKMSDTFKENVDAAFAKVQEVVSSTIDYFAIQGPNLWNGFIEGTESAWEEITRIYERSIDYIGSTITNITDWFNNLSGPLKVVADYIASSFSSIGNVIATLSPLIARFGLSFLGVTGPIGWVIASVISLSSFLYKLINNNEEAKSSLLNAWKSVKTAVEPIVDLFQIFGSTLISALIPAITEIASSFATLGPEFQKTGQVLKDSFVKLGPSFAELGSAIAELGSTLVPIIGQLFSTWIELSSMMAFSILPILVDVVQAVFPVILSVIQTVLPVIFKLLFAIIPIVLQIATMVLPMILDVVQMVFPMILSIIQTVLPIVLQLLSAIIPIIMLIATTVLPLILQVVQAVFPIILAVIQAVIPVISMILTSIATVITSVVVPAIQVILQVVQFVFPLIMTVIQTSLDLVTGIFRTFSAILQGDWSGAWEAIKGTAVKIMNNIISFFKSINLFEVGKSIITGLINGIKSMGGEILGAITKLIPKPIRGAASKLLGKLPGFADGGVVSAPTLAWIGEGGDTETVIPWNNSSRSKSLWLQTGEALGMLNNNGLLSGMQQQVNLQTNRLNASAIQPQQVMANSSNGAVIQVQYSPSYQVSNPADLELVKQHAENDQNDLLARLAEIQRNERRLAFE